MSRFASLMVALLLTFSGAAVAKVPPEQAERLKRDLTPLGGEKAGNADGSIPAWNGGLYRQDHKAGERYVDPFPDDKPLYVISSENFQRYKDKLSVGQMNMFAKYPTYKIPVYPTRRTAAAPDFIYEATFANASRAELANNGESLRNAITGVPFPIPQTAQEIIWNHKTRYRGLSVSRFNMQATVQPSGRYALYKIREDVKFNYNFPKRKPEDLNNVIIYFLQRTLSPPRQAGTILLVHETMDQVVEPRRAWQYNPGQRRLRRAPNVGYDNPGTGSDGLRTNDQLDVFNGATDRYTWKLVGKKEMIVPYNAYRLHSDKLQYDDIIMPRHINQDHTRYELHRVWVVEANLRQGTSHIYKRRTFYVDEDSWSILLVDIYDARDQLWRFQEGHALVAYDFPATVYAMGTVYDFNNQRYLAMEMNNQEPETVQTELPDSHFAPANVAKLATR